jgi:hypothetical protein
MVADNLVLRRYTDLPSAINILRRQVITLLPPSSWDDRNDRHMMAAYKRVGKFKTVLALCFAECPEAYHHWKVFTSGSSGICIEFHRKLIASLPNYLTYKSVDYKKIKQLDPEQIDVEDLPFIKRIGFSDEHEFRIVYASKHKKLAKKDITISLDVIKRILVNPWLHEELSESVIETLIEMAATKNIVVSQSSLIDSPSWRRFADGYA